MRFNSLSLSMFSAGLVLSAAASAQNLDFTLINSDATVSQGMTSLAFDGVISNPSKTATIFLNGDSYSNANPLLIDDSAFFDNAPLSLAPGASSGPLELFDVTLLPTAALGEYSGNSFSILGGADAGTNTIFDTVGKAYFTVTVSAPATMSAPEIDSASAVTAMTFLLGLLAVFVAGRANTEERRGGAPAPGNPGLCGTPARSPER